MYPQLSLISKVNTFVLGMVSYAFVFAVENMGSILPATSSLLGIMLGPTFGIFTLGMMFPWANAKGSLLGMIAAFILMITYIIGNLSADGLPDQRLFLDTSSCSSENETIHSTITSTSWKDEEYSGITKLLSVSYSMSSCTYISNDFKRNSFYHFSVVFSYGLCSVCLFRIGIQYRYQLLG